MNLNESAKDLKYTINRLKAIKKYAWIVYKEDFEALDKAIEILSKLYEEKIK